MAARSNAGRSLVLPVSVGVVGLTLIGIGQAVPNRHAIEDDLTSRSTEALKSADLTGFSVSFTGRDATVTGDSGGTVAQAVAVVESVDGVRVVNTETASLAEDPAAAPSPSATPAETPTTEPAETAAPTSAPAETPAAAKPALPVGFTLVDGTITVTGTVESEAAQGKLIDAVKAVGKGWNVVDRLVVDDTLPPAEPKANRLAAVTTLLAKAPIDGPKLVIQFNKGSVILRGTPSDAASEKALLTAASGTVAKKSAVVDGLDTQ
jgi:osmotically-inducible protein OsmY